MTSGDKSVFHSRKTTRDFLFSRTAPERLAEATPQEAVGFPHVLQAVYPQICVGQDFIDQAMQHVRDSQKFAVLVIRLDPGTTDNKDDSSLLMPDAYLEIAKTLNRVCQNVAGLWGTLDSAMLAGFLPEQDSLQTVNLAGDIQKRFKEKTTNTVTIGIAQYPTLSYTKSDIITNARKALDHATFFGPNSLVVFDAVSLNISGDRLYEQGSLPSAIDEFKKALALDPANINVHNSLGVCYGLQGDFSKAIKEFETAVSLDPEEYMALYNLGLVNLLADRRDQALDYFLKAHEVNPSVYEIEFQTGKLYLETGNIPKALSFLEHAVSLNPDAANVHRLLGDCYAASAMTDAAVSAYEKAIKQNPADAASMSALGYYYDQKGENPEIALLFCRESVELAPKNSFFRYRLAQIYSHQNRLHEALRELKKAAQLGYDAAQDIGEIEKRLAEQAN